ncbi:transcriptional regulator [Saccharomonospora viridis DSM 43017]|uniref:Transcriptional regulator n=1 Tax=Saccharomonospora viridis (strain ATCC 15386 / DSM 43017 / JCM 3036 / CCUG 5913 / NBRC 12207 / NCIMB 9602 / P101) TaxID=471857 RepID=C7MVY5_SACVD|nr:transcriptional regulator [Saccharomonospora viridis DSM 43017]
MYSFSVQRNNDPYRIEAVDRALTLVTLLAERGSLSVTEAGRELGVAPSTAHRLLSTLCHRQFAVQGDKRLYRPGPALLALAKAGGPPLADRIRPYLQRLYDLVGETVHLMVRTGAEIRFVDGIESRHPLRVGLRTGARMPAYCTSGGKAMLADLEPSEIDALHAGGLPPWPGEKIHNLSALHETLEAVRRNRLGVNHEESEPGVTAIGASIGWIDGQHAALTTVLPTVRLATVDLETVTTHLLQVCADVRQAFGDNRDTKTAR